MKLVKLLFFLFAIASTQPAYAVETRAKHAYLIDADTGAVLFAKEAEVQMPPSSMSKLMTMYMVFERMKEGRLKLDDTLPVSEKAWRMQGSKMFVPLGESIKVDDLIHGVIVQSGNDACIVFAEGLAGSEEAFAELMNKKAKELGMMGSHFVNSTGWPDERHLMTAKDLALLGRRIIKDFPGYYPNYAVKEFTYHNIVQHNRNRLLGNDIGVDGMKTGHTEVGGYGITLSAKHDNRRLVLVINGLASDDERVKEGDLLLRYGFREFKNVTLVPAGKQVAAADVFFGKSAQVPLEAANDVVVTLPAGANNKVDYKLRYNAPLPAPIKKGDAVAELVVGWGDAEAQIIPLVASENMEKISGFAKIIATLKIKLGIAP